MSGTDVELGGVGDPGGVCGASPLIARFLIARLMVSLSLIIGAYSISSAVKFLIML